MKTPLLASLRQAFRLAQTVHTHPHQSIAEVVDQHQQRLLDRRQFLRGTAQTGAVLGLGGATVAKDWLNIIADQTAPRIAIVGAGIGGLSAGYYLRQKGIAATIFEADKRVGGRIKTGRMFGGGNLFTEIGAEFIDTVHTDMLRLVRALGLENKLLDVDTDTVGERDAFFIENKHHSLREVVAEMSAAADLRLRGPGNIEGTQQSGMLRFLLADLARDSQVLAAAREIAANILEADPALQAAEHLRLRQHLETEGKDARVWSRIS